MRGAFLVPAILIVLLSPWGEGGRTPLLLLALHSLALLVMVVSALRAFDEGSQAAGAGLPRPIGLALALVVCLAIVSALHAGYPLAAAFGLWDIAVAIGLFGAAVAARPAGDDLRVLCAALVASTSLQAVIAIAHRPLGVLQAARTFLNPNHLAAFLNVGLVLCADRAAASLERVRRRALVFWCSLTVLHFTAAALLMSRGATLGLFVALTLLFAARGRLWSAKARRIAFSAIVAAALVGAGLIVLRFERSEDPYRYDRLSIWKASVEILADRPLLGHGPGMFRYSAPSHNFPSTVGPFRYEKVFSGAHDAFLTFAAEDGIPATVLLLLAVSGTLLSLWRSGVGGEMRGRALAIALAALLVQGLVDDLQERPALTLVPALLIGTALSRRDGTTWGVMSSGGGPAPGPAPALASPRAATAAAKGALILVALYLFIMAIALPYLADRDAGTAVRAGRAGLERMQRAARLNPFHPEYRKDLAMAVLHSGSPTPERYAEAARDLLSARRLKPIDPWYPMLLGRLEGQAAATLFEDRAATERAIGYYRESARLAPTDPRPLFELAGYLSSLGRPQEALGAVEGALAIEPHFLRARMLEASLLTRLGRHEEASASLRRLEESRGILAGVHPESGYARELMADDPSGSERLPGDLGGVGTSVPAGAVH